VNPWILIAETWVFVKSLPRRKDLLFWLIVFPAILLLMINFIFSPREAMVSFEVGVIDLDGGEMSRAIVRALNETGVLNPVVLGGGVDVGEVLRRREYPLVVVIPEGFTSNITEASRASIKVYYLEGSQESRVALDVFKGFISGFRDNVSSIAAEVFIGNMPEPFKNIMSGYIQFISNPLALEPHPVKTREAPAVRAFKVHVVMTVIGISLLYTGILSGLYAVVEKRYEGYVQALLSSPIRAHQFLLSEIVAVLAGTLISITTIVVVGLALGAPLHEIPPHRLLVSLTLMVVSVLGLTGLGMVLAVLTKTPQAAGALGNAIAFPVMFLGGFTIPKWMLPSWLQVFPEVIPHSRLIYSTIYYTLGEWSLEEMLAYALPAITLSLTLLLLGALTYRRVLEKIYESP
jgi:ABC-2 type transport system permease protein